MYLYKIEICDPIGGFTYPNEIYGSLYAAKKRLGGIIQDLKDAGVKYEEREGEHWYELSFRIGMGVFAYYRYNIVSVGYIGHPDQDKKEGE